MEKTTYIPAEESDILLLAPVVTLDSVTTRTTSNPAAQTLQSCLPVKSQRSRSKLGPSTPTFLPKSRDGDGDGNEDSHKQLNRLGQMRRRGEPFPAAAVLLIGTMRRAFAVHTLQHGSGERIHSTHWLYEAMSSPKLLFL